MHKHFQDLGISIPSKNKGGGAPRAIGEERPKKGNLLPHPWRDHRGGFSNGKEERQLREHIEMELSLLSGSARPESLSKLCYSLMEAFKPSGRRAFIDAWLQERGPVLLRDRHPALPAVLEAAAQTDIPSAGDLLAAVLMNVTTDDTARIVAAQRLRLTYPREVDGPKQRAIFHVLREHAQRWATEQPSWALLAWPSLAHYINSSEMPWFAAQIESESAAAVVALLGGVLDRVCGNTSRLPPLTAEDLGKLTQAIRQRLQQEQAKPPADPRQLPDVVASLVWTLGGVVGTADLPRAAFVIAQAYLSHLGLERAAALRSARLLVLRHTDDAMYEIMQAFGENRRELARFLRLVGQSSA